MKKFPAKMPRRKEKEITFPPNSTTLRFSIFFRSLNEDAPKNEASKE